MKDTLLPDFFLGLIHIRIFNHANQEEVFGFKHMAELPRYGYHMDPGTLYPIMHGLERK